MQVRYVEYNKKREQWRSWQMGELCPPSNEQQLCSSHQSSTCKNATQCCQIFWFPKKSENLGCFTMISLNLLILILNPYFPKDVTERVKYGP